jgi:hypothetical protein
MSDEGLFDWINPKYEEILNPEVDDIGSSERLSSCSFPFAFNLLHEVSSFGRV